MPQMQIGSLAVAGVILAFIGLWSTIIVPQSSLQTDITILPQEGHYAIEELFTITIEVHSETPVNVFSGDLYFDPRILQVTSIDYNTSIADLWAINPWYSNGDGTLTFAGGTTRAGGFTGAGSLITVTFRAVSEGDGTLRLENARVLKHDGLGTDAELSDAPIDALFTIEADSLELITIARREITETDIQVISPRTSFDLNNDGEYTFKDTGVFMKYLSSQDLRADFNGDRIVNLIDLNLLLKTLSR